MKKLSTLLLFIALITVSCSDSIEAPPSSGDDFVGTTFEFTGDFTQTNNFQLFFNFEENGFIPYESDVILAYILWESDSGIDYWRPLPQTVYLSNGNVFDYNYDFAADITGNRILDMSVFLDGMIDFSTLPPAYTIDQTFRIVVVPSDFLKATNVDVNNMESIINSDQIRFEAFKVELN